MSTEIDVMAIRFMCTPAQIRRGLLRNAAQLRDMEKTMTDAQLAKRGFTRAYLTERANKYETMAKDE